MPQEPSLYERFAAELEAQIAAGSFPEGSRLPSLRDSSRQHKLSMSTVIEAYRLLETRGLVEARPQSGYYVAYRPQAPVLEPEEEAGAEAAPTGVSIDELSMELFRDTQEADFAQFGAATPDPALLPGAKLDRILAGIAREGGFALDTSVTPEGCEPLRAGIARRAFGAGASILPDEIVVTAGCSEAMTLALLATCEPGDLVAIESPAYFGVLLILEALRLRALEIPTNPGTGLSLEALEFALDHHPVKALIAMPNFANPLGSLMPEETKAELAALLERRGLPLIENDIYGELHAGLSRPGLVKSGAPEQVLLCSSFSKDVSPGYRIGWIAPGRFARRVRHLKMSLSSGTSVLAQLTIARYLESGGYDAHLRAIRRAYARKLAGMRRGIEAYFPEGTRVSAPEGGYLLWVRLPGGLDATRLYHAAAEARIAIAPGQLFSPSGKFRDYVRLNAAAYTERTDKDLERLGRIAAAMLG